MLIRTSLDLYFEMGPPISAGPAYRQGRLLPRAPLYSGLLFEIIKYYIYL